jgi:hypothetical protein
MTRAKLEIDLPELADTMVSLGETVVELATVNDEMPAQLADPGLLQQELIRLTDTLRHLDAQPEEDPNLIQARDPDGELRALSDQGMKLLEQLDQWFEFLELHDSREALDEVVVTFGVWASRHLGHLHKLEPIVNALSKVANSTQDPDFLAELCHVFQEITDAVAPAIKDEAEQANPARAWRVLNLNYGIVATRSHRPEIMEQAFEHLMIRLPEDAPGFFQEGMQQMEIVGYPEHVRHVMEKYFHLTNNPTLH